MDNIAANIFSAKEQESSDQGHANSKYELDYFHDLKHGTEASGSAKDREELNFWRRSWNYALQTRAFTWSYSCYLATKTIDSSVN